MLEFSLYLSLTLGVSAFCSMAEASFYSLSRGSIETMRRNGKTIANKLDQIKDHIDHYIATILILNTIANSVGIILSSGSLSKIYPNMSPFTIATILTIMILLFAEIVPKTMGVRYHLNISRFLAHPLIITAWLLHPVVYLVGLITSLISSKDDKNQFSHQEIISMAALSAQEGSIDVRQELLIRNILQLKQRNVHDVMSPRRVIFAMQKDISIKQSITQYGNWEFSRIPLYGKNPEDIQGHVLRREAYNSIAEGKDERLLSELMRPILYVPESQTLDRLLQTFLVKSQHMAAVIDEYGGFSGIVTLEDVLEALLGEEIIDEFDQQADMQELAREQSRKNHRKH
jgi:CBS domain containing-hemolysin-like protein